MERFQSLSFGSLVPNFYFATDVHLPSRSKFEV
jgi:hypothetical protein